MQLTFPRVSILTVAMFAALAGCSGSKPEPEEAAKTAAAAETAAISAQEQALDLSYIGPDFFAAVVLQPQRIAKSPLTAPLWRAESVAGFIRRLGVEPSDIRQAVILFPVPTLNKPAGAAEAPTFVVRFARPIDARALLLKFQSLVMRGAGQAMAETTCAGKKCYQFAAAPWVLAHVPDDRTILLGTDRDMKKLLASPEAKGPLADRLRQADSGSDAILAMALDPVREFVNDGTEESKRGVPPEVARFLDIPGLLKGGTVTMHLDGDMLLAAVLEARDAAAAGKVEQLLNEGREMGRKQLAATREGLPASAAENFGPVLNLAAEGLEGITVTSSKNDVRIAMKRPAGLEEAIPRVAALFLNLGGSEPSQAKPGK